MKKAVFFLIILSLLSCLSYSSFALENVVTGDINVFVNDTKIIFDTQPVFIRDRTMVPIRGVFEALGATVEWDNDDKIVTITKDIKIQVQLNNSKALVDGTSVTMEVPAVGIDGRILVPLRFISEALEANVDWVNSTKTVYINGEDGNFGNIQNWGKYSADEASNYYIMKDDILLRENIETKKFEKIADNIVCDLHIYDNWIYCIGIERGINKAVRINKANNQKEIITDTPVDSIQVVNDWVYYINSDDDSILYRTKTDGSETEKIIEGGGFSPKNWLVQNGWVYFANLKSNSISRCRIDGTDLTELTKLNVSRDNKEEQKDSQSNENRFKIELIDSDFLYVSLKHSGYTGIIYYTPGLYRLPVKGGRPSLISNNVPVSVNMDDDWLYMAVENNGSYQLIRHAKDRSESFRINEYKQNDIPKYIYINKSSLYYTLLRGIGSPEELFFKMSSQGGNISTFSVIYGDDYYQVRDILTQASEEYRSLDSYSMLKVSSSGKEPGRSITSDNKISNSQSLYYQRLNDENQVDYLEIWSDKMFTYSKYTNEAQWTINEASSSDMSISETVFDFFQPTQELCNNLSLHSEYAKYVLRGQGAFKELITNLLNSKVLPYDYSNGIIDSAAIEITVNRSTNYIEELKLELYYYDTISEDSYTDRYHFVNSMFNSIYLSRPPELFKSVNDKNRALNSIEAGKKKLNEGKYEDAIALFDTAISFYNKAYDAYLYKGEALYHHGKYNDAILTYEQYYKLNPSDSNALILQGMSYLKLGNLTKAEELAIAVIEAGEHSVNAYNLVGAVAYKREDYRLAYEYYNKAINLDPYFYKAHIQALNTLFNSGNYTKCINDADAFLKRFPWDRNIMFIKARCLSHQGNSVTAIDVFKDILMLDPSNDFVTMTYIAIEYENLQDYSQSMEYAYKAQAVYADYSLLKYLIQKLEYDISTSSSQKLVDFLRKYYLYYDDSYDLKKALDNFAAKRNNFNLDDVKNLIEAIKSPDDTSTMVITGSDYKNLVDFDNNSFMDVKEEWNVVNVKIKSFTNKSGIKFSEYIQSLSNTQNKTLLLDLRDNTGGLSDEANTMLDILLGESNTCFLIDRDGYISIPFNKIGILVNEKTAGSSELLALGLKTYLNNVTIIGKKTMGKGTGQVLYLDRGKEYGVFLVNHYWNVKQENIHGKGILPDIAVENGEKDYSKAIELFLNN